MTGDGLLDIRTVEEVEALVRQRVEARMKELVCRDCGMPQPERIDFSGSVYCCAHRAADQTPLITRAEYESRKERERER